jgi:hypothetical protein
MPHPIFASLVKNIIDYFRLAKISPASASSASGGIISNVNQLLCLKSLVVSRFLCFSGGSRYSSLAKKCALFDEGRDDE